MFSVLIFFLFIWAVYKFFKALFPSQDKKDEVQTAAKIQKLPRIYIQGKVLSTTQKVLNMCSSGDLIKSFSYDDSNQMLRIEMQDGKWICDRLDKYSASFSTNKGLLFVGLKNSNGASMTIPKIDAVLSKKEWEIVLTTLTLSGRTYNKNVLGSHYQLAAGAKAIAQIVKLLS